ncbi:hypothetical protein F2Q68_00030949 [Brassica cretica]|uniref:FKB95-like N-terminal Kelch domain-containing protein n=1 Tax=Brassica cretica TaxID=69181 RepID=A0A8S9G5T3_BRACR|nr:hypothetical protein F2Q68_00030949 [Brassica cretica]
MNCLARISRASYPRLSIISKSFRSFLSTKELYLARSQIGSTEQCLFDETLQCPQWSTLWINPNPTLKKKKKKKKTLEKLLAPIPPSDFPSVSQSALVVGSEIYVIRTDQDKTHDRDAPSMIVARKYALACFYDGKIYVMGGCGDDDEPGHNDANLGTSLRSRH